MSNGSPTFDQVEFSNSEGARGADLYAAAGANVTITNSSFEDSAGKYGGNIYVLDAAVTMSNTTASAPYSQYSAASPSSMGER